MLVSSMSSGGREMILAVVFTLPGRYVAVTLVLGMRCINKQYSRMRFCPASDFALTDPVQFSETWLSVWTLRTGSSSSSCSLQYSVTMTGVSRNTMYAAIWSIMAMNSMLLIWVLPVARRCLSSG